MDHTATSALERRLAAVEDRMAIYNLIASHPLSADTGYGPLFPHLYTNDAIFDRGASAHGATGRDQLIALVESEEHQQAIADGLAHFGNLPYIQLDGDTAVVTSYLMLLRFNRDEPESEMPNHGLSRGHQVFRVVANRWVVVRTENGWRIKSRRLFPMDGSRPARDLLNETVSLAGFC